MAINAKVKANRKLTSIPEILYESPNYPGERVSPIPYVNIPKDKDMPVGLFLMEYRSTGEYEVGDRGRPEEIMDGPYPHMYVDFKYIEEVLAEQFPELDIKVAVDKIREGLGLKPIDKARKDGTDMLNRVVENANKMAAEAVKSQEERMKIYEQLVKMGVVQDDAKGGKQ